MADLYKHDESDRESWIRWAVEFMKRGLWLADEITVHGPHPGAAYMWGEAEASGDGAGKVAGVEVEFRTAQTTSIHRVHGVHIFEKGGGRDGAFPLLKPAELSNKAKRWLRAASRQLKRFKAQRIAAAKFRAAVRTRMAVG